MTLRGRLLSLTLSMVAIVAVTLVALNLNSLTVTSLDAAISSSEMAGQQVQSFLLRRLTESLSQVQTRPASLTEMKDFWSQAVSHDADLAAILEQTMAQSRSIVEIDVAGENGAVLTSSSPQRRGSQMAKRQELRNLRDASPLGRILGVLSSREDYETRVPLGISGQNSPLFTIQILVSPVLLRAVTLPALRDVVIASGLALLMAFGLAYWSSNLALRPLAHISHLIDDIVSGKTPEESLSRANESRELAVIENKLSILGERFRGAREDATQLRTNLEGALEKLDSGTRRQVEDQIAIARRLTAINSLTGRVAHEIKNPLNSISLRLEMLRSRIAEETPDVDGEFSILLEEVMRLDRVVRTFLDFNRAVELNFAEIDLAETVMETLQFLELEAESHGIGVIFNAPNSAVIVRADQDLLRQALQNIAVNAIEAMRDGGRLCVEVGRGDETCSVRISDTGPGLSPEQREKIFQLYYTTKPQGTGIGLAMTFRAVQLHGGTIEVESEMGNGATFKVTLPLAGMARLS